MDEDRQQLVKYLVDTGTHPDLADTIADNVTANPTAATSQAYTNAAKAHQARGEADAKRGQDWGEFLQKPVDAGIVESGSSGPQTQAQLDNSRGALDRRQNRQLQQQRDDYENNSAKFAWVQPKQKAQQMTAQMALAMVQQAPPMMPAAMAAVYPQMALDTASKLLAPLHNDAFLGIKGEDNGGFAQHGLQKAAAKFQSDQQKAAGGAQKLSGALGSLYQGD